MRFIITGSVAALLHGVPLEPGDLDVTPALDRENLERLAAALTELEATPSVGAGKREGGTWVETGGQVPWPPDPGEPESFDTLLASRLGAIDVVPEVSGTYEALLPRSVEIGGITIASIDDLLATMTQAKHVERAAALRALRR